MANSIQISVLANVQNAANGINNINGQLSSMGQSVGRVTSLAKTMVTGFLALGAIKAVGGFLGDSITAASDLNETVSKSNTIFGEAAGAVNAWASTSATSVGLSKAAALDAASGFGNMFSQLGFTSGAAADLSTKTVQMAADLGSFNNLPTADVADKISGALRGEYDSLQALIPNINGARVEQEAMAATGKTNADQLTAQEKAAATLAIVQRDGAAAMGDFARTSDGLANQQKILQAKFEDVKTVVGSALLPIMTSLAALFLDKVVPAATAAGQWFGDVLVPKLKELGATVSATVLPVLQSMGAFFLGTIVPALQSAAGFIAQNSTAFTTLGIVLGTLYAGFVIYNTAMSAWAALTRGYAAVQLAFNAIMAINPFVLIIIGLTALVAGLVYAYKNSETFRNIVNGVWESVKGVVSGVLGWFTGTLLPGIVNVYNSIKNGVQTVLSIYISVWASIISTVASVPGRITGFFSGIVGFFTGLWSNVKDGAVTGFNNVVSFVAGIPGRILSALGSLGGLLTGAGKSVIDGFLNGITSAFGKVKDKLTSLTNLLPDWKGPAEKDAVILRGAGKLVIGGFINGLESQYGNVQKSLGGLTDNLSSGFSGELAIAGSSTGGSGTTNLNITVNAGAGADGVEIGRQLVGYIKQFVNVNGSQVAYL